MTTESQHLEYKSEITDSLEREVVGFLNSREGGRILIGVDDFGTALGLTDPDGDQLKIKDRLRHNIQPSCLGLFDVLIEKSEGSTWIKLLVASGSEKPYYLRKQGMSPRGCFIRIGSATEPMTERQIETFFARRTRNSISRIVAPRQNLKFSQLKIYYEATGREPGPQFLQNLELYTDNNRYNYAAYLLADINNTSIKVAKYAGTDRVDLIENEEYGNCCLVKATKQVLDKLDLENRTLTRMTFPFTASDINEVKNEVKSKVKSKVKTPDQLIGFFRKNPNATLQDAANALGKSLSTMEKASTQLRKQGKIRHDGPQKGGHWEILKE